MEKFITYTNPENPFSPIKRSFFWDPDKTILWGENEAIVVENLKQVMARYKDKHHQIGVDLMVFSVTLKRIVNDAEGYKPRYDILLRIKELFVEDSAPCKRWYIKALGQGND